jgi:mercuric ion binding protein
MKIRILALLGVWAAASGTTLAATRTLHVQNMTCGLCPVTVKKALERVSGVQRVTVDYAGKTATVQFDDTVVTVDRLTEATGNAGYPSSLKEDGK